jgi:two-component system nitrogen regulation response regulator NtrX
VKVDVRIISSTARNLEELIAAGEFPRISTTGSRWCPVRVPSLSERREDIPFLVDMFMRQVSEQAGIRNRRIGEDALAVIQAHTWPGNIRQLRNYMERLMILARSDGPETVISADMLPDDVSDMLPKTSAAGSNHIMTLAAAGGARTVRARLSDRPDQPLWRQHFPHSRICGDGAVCPASQIEIAWRISGSVRPA